MSNPLKGSPERQAVAPIAGFLYQIWQSVLSWITLEHELVHTLAHLYDAVLQPSANLMLSLFNESLVRDPDDHTNRDQGH
jgi:hypothetical protein